MIRAEREVVLSAGVYGSPHLLMLSGIGPADHLRAFGIDVVADLPVGDNLHDHLFVPMSFAMPTALRKPSPAYFGRAFVKERFRTDSTWLARSVFEVVAFVRTPHAAAVPDLQLHVLPWSYPSPNQDAPIRHKPDPRQALTIMSTLIYPKSRGTFRLTSADPTAAPAIDPNYLDEQHDIDVLVDGMELIRETMAARPIAAGVQVRDRARPVVRRRAPTSPRRCSTGRRPSTTRSGTCRMGVDERAVVDPQLRVRGIDGLRVADASIMPSIVGGNTNAASMMIGERAAELILAERDPSARSLPAGRLRHRGGPRDRPRDRRGARRRGRAGCRSRIWTEPLAGRAAELGAGRRPARRHRPRGVHRGARPGRARRSGRWTS